MNPLDEAVAQLAQSDAAFREAIAPVSPAQWTWKPDIETWSIGECAEHLVIVEQGILHRLRSAPPDAFEKTVGKERLPEMVANRTVKFPAPARLQPGGRRFATPDECLAQWTATRAATLAWAQHPDTQLHRHVMPHPAFGELHGVQWLQMMAGHTLRHISQMHEVMAREGYPG